MPIRTDIREAIKTTFAEYASPYFTSYPTINTKDYDIAGLSDPDYYPVVNVLTTHETYMAQDSIGKDTKDMLAIIDIIPWADEVNGHAECDKLFEEIPQVIYSNPQWGGKAVDTTIKDVKILSLGTDAPALKIRAKLIIRYRQARPL